MDSGEFHVDLLIQENPLNPSAFEPVHVREAGDGVLEVLYSPGWVLNVAAGDKIRLLDEPHGAFEIVERGRNVAVQIFCNGPIDDLCRELTPLLAAIGGRLDGRLERTAVYTIPVAAGFERIEAALDQVMPKQPAGTEWIYGNVYDVEDGQTPLNWWL